MIDLFSKIPALAHFSTLLEDKDALLVERLWDAPKALLITLAMQKGYSVLVITGGAREEHLLEDLPFFGMDKPLIFPSWETLPGESVLPSPDIIGKRYEILSKLQQVSAPQVLLCPLQACLQKVTAPADLKRTCEEWKVGDTQPFDLLPELLEELGYTRMPVVSDKGQYALRGGLIDLFPLASTDPFRIDFFGDEIDAIRRFDPISQKSIGKEKSFFLTPAFEKVDDATFSLVKYMPDKTLIIFDDIMAIEDKWVSIKDLPGAKSPQFLQMGAFCDEVSAHKKMYWTKEPIEKLAPIKSEGKVLNFEIFGESLRAERWHAPFIEIKEYFSPFENEMASNVEELIDGMAKVPRDMQVHFFTSSDAEERHVKEMLSNAPKSCHFERGYLSSGFALSEPNLAIFPYPEFTGRMRIRREKWRGTHHLPAAEFHALSKGDLVVHFHHGIGKFLGIKKEEDKNGEMQEYMLIQYDKGGSVMLPASQSHLVSRYIGAQNELPTLHTIGSKSWQRTKQSAQTAILGYASDLLEMSAQRELAGGVVYPPDSDDMRAFEEEFPFIPTDDQMRAIQDIKADMQSEKAMDRLICGDVGYGKTEVAMRAAFKAVVDGGKQVAVLVPTTVLATQHFDSFRSRMESFPLRIEVLSRTCTAKETAVILEDVRAGKVDILIGTHRIVSKDICFKDLGLVIVDEEQRFGVRVKEKLKALRAGVDCLILSATPIPRTLYLSMVGARDVSTISTPPQDRLPIKTILGKRCPETIRNALTRELARDGQAFFIHNRVESIGGVKQEIEELIPDAKIGIAHGQMNPEVVEDVFHAFKKGELDILLATSIIENGIDVPNANTIIVDQSQLFGLGDLYQIRGRVGRWNRPAFAYFLTPYKGALPEETAKRLNALAETSGHGGGMRLAMRDLEIRGAGDILGTKQSGQIASIGFHLYCKLLKRTVKALQTNQSPNMQEVHMASPFPARLPETYISDASVRLEIYNRLGEVQREEEIAPILDELVDRFGKYPLQVEWLEALTRIRIFAGSRGITHLVFKETTYVAKRQGTSKGFLFGQRQPHSFAFEVIETLKNAIKQKLL